MMLILIPCLIQMLIDSSQQNKATKFSRLLHEHSLQRLKKIGPMYPLPFKSVIEQSPAIKTKLETALKADQEKAKRQSVTQNTSAASLQPKIQLKMNFSNFK